MKCAPSTSRIVRTKIITTFWLREGTYLFGDPGYLFNGDTGLTDELWTKFCTVSEKLGECSEVIFGDPSHFLCYGNTKHGDGSYILKYPKEQEVPVDAGLLAWISKDLALRSVEYEELIKASTYAVCELKHGLRVTYADGNWYRGDDITGRVICGTSE